MTIIDAVREQHRTPVVSLLVDTDVHPMYSVNDLLSRLDEPWRSRVARFGEPSGPTQSAHVNFPRLRNGGVRLD